MMKTRLTSPKAGGENIFYKLKKAFTLVELIIVITILAILATIAFLNFADYPAQTRDGVRMQDLKTIEKGLQIYNAENGKLPELAVGATEEEIDGTDMRWKKGKFGEEQYKEIKNISTLPVDPKTHQTYDYYKSVDGKYYYLTADLENGEKFVLTNLYSKNSENNLIEKEIIIPNEYGDCPDNLVNFRGECRVATLDDMLWGRLKNEGNGEDRFKFLNGTTLGENGIVLDKASGLIWESEPNKSKFTFEEAKQRCLNLNKGGFTDWRMPDITELRTLLKPSSRFKYYTDFFIFDGKYKAKSDYVASSTGKITNTGIALWSLYSNLDFGGDTTVLLRGKYQSLCVHGKSDKLPYQGTIKFSYDILHSRGSDNFTEDRFSFLNGTGKGENGLVKDSVTGFIWESVGSNKVLSIDEAKERCNNLTKGGLKWRLPSILELASLSDYSRDGKYDSKFFVLYYYIWSLNFDDIFKSNVRYQTDIGHIRSPGNNGYGTEENGIYKNYVLCIH